MDYSDGEPVSCGGAYTEMYTKCIKAGMKFLIRDRQSKIHKRNAVRLVIQDLMEQGKTPDQVCEVIKTCFDSFITETAYAELGEAEKDKYDEIKYKNVSCYCRGLHIDKFLAMVAEYGIKIEPVTIRK